jgi:hypothetical protein
MPSLGFADALGMLPDPGSHSARRLAVRGEHAGGGVSLEPLARAPDDKDWTWVLASRCPDCGFDTGALRIADVAPMVRDTAAAFAIVVRARMPVSGRSRASGRRSSNPVTSATSSRVFDQRLRLMLATDDPLFPTGTQSRDDNVLVEIHAASINPLDAKIRGQALDSARSPS